MLVLGWDLELGVVRVFLAKCRWLSRPKCRGGQMQPAHPYP